MQNRINLPVRHTLTLAAIAALIGCGHGPAAPASGVHIQSLSGQIHGGQSPIQGALIKLYHTDPTATTYGAPGILIGTALSDAGGNYSIGSNSGSSVTSTNCPAGTMAYLTGAGGYQPGQPTAVNNNLLLMDALGDCANISTSTFAVINEVTTVAAAYALSGFMTTSIDGSTAFYTANVSAPVANSTLITAITPTTPAGLAHAFMNAAKLANPSVGTANYTTTAYTGGVNGTIGSVPGNEINTLADMMQPCINSASLAGGAVSSIPISNGGSGYGATVSVTSALGTGATANAIVNSSGVVIGLQLTNRGSGYSPTITFNAPGSGAVAIPSLTNGVVTNVTMESYGSGYGPSMTIVPDPAYPGTGATAGANIQLQGQINAGTVLITGGSGYGPHATVSASPYGGTTGTFSPQISGTPGSQVTVGSYVLTSAGSGYSPNVHFSAATGSGAAGYTDLNSSNPGAVSDIVLTAGGSGYPSGGPVTVTIDPPAGGGTTATATATVNSSGVITGLTLTSGGSGYTLPTITIDPSPYGTTPTYSITSTKNGAIYAIGVPTSGGGYPLPSVTVGPTGAGVTFSSIQVTNGVITSLFESGTPSGDDNTATFSAPPAGGSSATGTPVLTLGGVSSVFLNSGGSGYGPIVTITGGTTNATATANVSDGGVSSLVLTGGGSGYAVPTVTVSAPSTPGGVTATATATTANGQISGVTITNGGSGYTSAPTVTFSAPASGTTAVAGTPVLTTDPGSAPVAPSNGLCSKLFTLTPSISGNIPNNTLQAFINLARNPYPSATAMDPTNGLLGLVSGTGAFQPTLTSVPTDWALAITYGSPATTAVTGAALPASTQLALDANDSVFAARNTALSTTVSPVYAVGAYGVSVPAFGGYIASQKNGAMGIATDLLGDIWGSANSALVFRYPSTGGTITTYTSLGSAYGLAADASNNIWVGHSSGVYTGNDVDEFVYTPGTGTWAQGSVFGDFPAGVEYLAVDANQNIWGASYYTSGSSGNTTSASVLANTGTVTAPNYNPSGNAIQAVTAEFSDGVSKPYSVALDASGNAWYNISGSTTSVCGLAEVTPNSPSSISSLTSAPVIFGTSTSANGNQLGTTNLATIPEIDGAGTDFVPDNTSSTVGLHAYSTITGNTLSESNGYRACLLASATTTTCGAGTAGVLASSKSAVIDSTGSVWVSISTGGVSQIIGLAAPTYPALATGKPGLSPGLSAVNPLP
jgi:hypothetical protein